MTIDAMGCQKDIAAGIVQGGGEFVLAVKENQPHLYEDIQRHFEEALEHGESGVELHRVPDGGDSPRSVMRPARVA